MAEMVVLDGSSGEGGGQILRSALTLSLLTGRPFVIENIRARRDRPGLRPQHLQAVQAAQRIGSAAVDGAAVGSKRLQFAPGPVAAGDYVFDVRTAGCAQLVLHTVALPLAMLPAPSKVTIIGGTHVAFAPCYDYLVQAWAPAMAELGLDIELLCDRCGFYPRGGGQIRATFPGVAVPTTLTPIDWKRRGKLLRVRPLSMYSGLPENVGQRQADQADRRLRKLGLRKAIRPAVVEERSGVGQGTMLGLRCEWEHASGFFYSLGARGKPAEKVADEAVDDLAAFLNADDSPVDPHLADQLLLPLAFTQGESTFRTSQVTQHLLTNADVIGRFVDRPIRIDTEPSGTAQVTM